MPGLTSCPERAKFYIDPATGLKHSCKRFCNTYPDYCTFYCPDFKKLCYHSKVATTTPGLTFSGSTSKANLVTVGNVSPYVYIGVAVAGLALLVIILWVAMTIYTLCQSKDSSNHVCQCCCVQKTDNVPPASNGNQVLMEPISGLGVSQKIPSDPEETERLLGGTRQSVVSTTASQNATAASLSGKQPVPPNSSTSRQQCTKHSTTGSLRPESAQSNKKKSRHKSAPTARAPIERSNGAVSSVRSTGYHSQMPVQQVDTSGAVHMLPSGSAEPFRLSSCQLQQLLSDASGYYVPGNHDNHSLPSRTQPLSLQSRPPLLL